MNRIQFERLELRLNLTSFVNIEVNAGGVSAFGADTADFNSDGQIDFLVSDFDSGFGIYPGNELGSVAGTISVGDSLFANGIFADLNGDSLSDILSWDFEGLRWFENTNGEYGESKSITDDPIVNSISSDIDADGDIDVIASVGPVGQLAVFLNDGKEFIPAGQDFAGIQQVGAMSVTDMTGDGL
ncbi:MAG: VCBS repeat-containing protein, partial [Planctomycetales bacterium]|nr:VCBS repeat-containing protein [Planctomycetales bacterium]